MIVIIIVGLIGCTNEEEISAIENHVVMYEETFQDIMALYSVASPILTVEDEEELIKTAREIHVVIEKLKDESTHFFSDEAREVVEQLTFSAEKALEHQEQLIQSDDTSELQQSVMEEISKIADFMRAYAMLYEDFLEISQ